MITFDKHEVIMDFCYFIEVKDGKTNVQII